MLRPLKTICSRFRRWSREGLFAEILSPGQRHESLFLEPLLESDQVGRRTRPESPACDKGFSAGRIRAHLRRRSLRAAIPYREDELRKRRGKRGHQPVLDRAIYRKRNAAERCSGWTKGMRAFASRSEKPEETFRAIVHLAMLRLCLNKIAPSDRAWCRNRVDHYAERKSMVERNARLAVPHAVLSGRPPTCDERVERDTASIGHIGAPRQRQGRLCTSVRLSAKTMALRMRKRASPCRAHRSQQSAMQA